ncbi:mucin-2-like [Sycon ciliatum]|uniref:mucin-2-like n=1 Tax=Sycon ciliatum TaxID=27933 RepID=UPI0031F61145
MEYSTVEEPTTLAPTSHGPMPTTGIARLATSKYIPAKPRTTSISPTITATEHTTQPTSEVPTTIGNWPVKASCEKPGSVQSQSTVTTTSSTTASAEPHISSMNSAGTHENAIPTTREATAAAPLPTIQSTSASLIAESTNYTWIGILTGSILTVVLTAGLFAILCKMCRRTSAQVRIIDTQAHTNKPDTQAFSNPYYSCSDLRGNACDPTRTVYYANPHRDYPPNQPGATGTQYTNTNPQDCNNLLLQTSNTSKAEAEYSFAGAVADHHNMPQQENREHPLYSCAEETSVLDTQQRTDSTYDRLRYASKEWGTDGDARQQVYSDVKEIDHFHQPQQSESSYDKLCHPMSAKEREFSGERQSQMDHGEGASAPEDQPEELDPTYDNVPEHKGGKESCAIADIQQQDYDNVDLR